MPLLKIQTNADLTDVDQDVLLKAVSSHLAEALGKPEQYVMVALEPPASMCFAGSIEPTAYLELKSIGLSSNETARLSEGLCQWIEDHLHIAPDRTYIEFANAEGTMWGWNGGTF